MLKTASENKAIHFNGLNGLRFIAALAVVITHIELIKGFWLLPNAWNNPFIKILGSLGVYFFFVLSGFLITYLLLIEKKQKGNIDVQSFYIRRILRIWPLYFIIFILGFFVLPNISFLNIPWQQGNLDKSYWGQFFCYLLILPNIAYGIWGPIPHISQSWSIGIEEQFYLFWPWLVKYSGNLVKTLIIVFIVIVLIKVLFLFLGRNIFAYRTFLSIKGILAMSKFECMAMGGIGAYFLYKKTSWFITIIKNKLGMILGILLLPILVMSFPETIQDGAHIVFSFIFLYIILNICFYSKKNSLLNSKWLDSLGKISYGIYMYHMLIIPFVIKLLLFLNIDKKNLILFHALSYLLSFITIILLSYLSYNYFEKKFIKNKLKYEKINSKA